MSTVQAPIEVGFATTAEFYQWNMEYTRRKPLPEFASRDHPKPVNNQGWDRIGMPSNSSTLLPQQDLLDHIYTRVVTMAISIPYIYTERGGYQVKLSECWRPSGKCKSPMYLNYVLIMKRTQALVSSCKQLLVTIDCA